MERDVAFNSNSVRLAGTLAVPDTGGRVPVVLLIPGSGQVDRNENHKKFRLNVFYDLAKILANKGFASMRYDKRGVGASDGNYWETGYYDNVSHYCPGRFRKDSRRGPFP